MKMLPEDGVIYCTSGEKYFNDAVISAKSFKKLHPEKKVAIFTEEDVFRNQIFDYHFPIFSCQEERDWVKRYYEKQPKKWMLKVICTSKSPFRRTVHLDSDTLVIQRIDELFDDLEQYDIILTHLDWAKHVNGKNIGIYAVRVDDAINSGVYAYSDTKIARYILGDKWKVDCEAGGFIKNEQSILTDYIRNPKIHLQGVRYKIADNVEFNATRRMWLALKEYGLWDHVRILHYGEPKELKKLFQGEINKDDLLELPLVKECHTADLKIIPTLKRQNK